MSNPRVRKIADRIQVIVAEMLERRIKDPRLGLRDRHRRPGHGGHPAGHDLLHRARRRRAASRVGHRRCAGVRQGPAPLRGRQAARHAAHADARRSSPTRCPRRRAHIDDLLAKARQADARSPRRPQRATYAGEADPYKKPREADDDDDGEDDDERPDA